MKVNSPKTVCILLAVVFMMGSAVNARLGAAEESEAPDLPGETDKDTVDASRELKNTWTSQQEGSWQGNDGDLCFNWEHQVVKGWAERCNKCKSNRGTMWTDVDGQTALRCGIQPNNITQPASVGDKKECHEKGVFLPADLKNRCCNGARQVIGGYRCT